MRYGGCCEGFEIAAGVFEFPAHCGPLFAMGFFGFGGGLSCFSDPFVFSAALGGEGCSGLSCSGVAGMVPNAVCSCRAAD